MMSKGEARTIASKWLPAWTGSNNCKVVSGTFEELGSTPRLQAILERGACP